MQQSLNKLGRNHIDQLKRVVSQLWKQSCKHDGIDPVGKFVVFSDSNPYIKFYNLALAQLWQAKKDFACGGYVGLKIH